jgi:hypothetical protein
VIGCHTQCQEVTGVILFTNTHAPTDNKSNDSKDSFRRVYSSHSSLNKIQLRDFNAKLDREAVLKTSNLNKNLCANSNDDGV